MIPSLLLYNIKVELETICQIVRASQLSDSASLVASDVVHILLQSLRSLCNLET